MQFESDEIIFIHQYPFVYTFFQIKWYVLKSLNFDAIASNTCTKVIGLCITKTIHCGFACERAWTIEKKYKSCDKIRLRDQFSIHISHGIHTILHLYYTRSHHYITQCTTNDDKYNINNNLCDIGAKIFMYVWYGTWMMPESHELLSWNVFHILFHFIGVSREWYWRHQSREVGGGTDSGRVLPLFLSLSPLDFVESLLCIRKVKYFRGHL